MGCKIPHICIATNYWYDYQSLMKFKLHDEISDPFMIAPFPLYVDEISNDKIKATVSNNDTVFYNLKMMALDMPISYRGNLFNGKNGIFIMPIGRFICMLVRDNGKSNMIILDLVDKEELAEKMAEKLNHADLRDKFMNVYVEIISHPENHKRFKLVIGNPEEGISFPFFRSF